METAEVGTRIKWGFDTTHSEIGFKVKHLMITNVKGVFKEFDAGIYASEGDFMTSEIEFWMNPASIDTGNEKRDEHLKGPDFFDVENHKVITFTGTTFKKADKNFNYILFGDLSIKGISKQVQLEVEFGGVMTDPWGNEKAGFTIKGEINRQDWRLNWNTVLETGGLLVGNDIRISCEIQLLKQAVEHIGNN